MDLLKEYFEWISSKVDGRQYRKLLETMFREDFYSLMPLDDNRIIDGFELIYKFAEDRRISRHTVEREFRNRKCSVLEMMVGLAFRIEETIMEDSDYGDRTSMWFWIMVKSLGLYEMTDNNFDAVTVLTTLDTFLNRGYKSNGEGGLFVIKDINKDMRDIDIWYQMNMFFENLL